MAEATPIVLLPGMLCDARLWAAQAELFEESRAVIVPNIANFDDLKPLATYLLKVEMPERFILGGLSMGGYLALEMMRQLIMQQGGLARVEKLILIATSARADTVEQTRTRRGLIELARKGKFKGVTPSLLPSLIHHGRVNEASITQTIFDMAETVGMEGFINQETAVMRRRDQRDILPKIACPTLILCGDDDQRTPPACSEEMTKAIRGAKYHLLPECGHLPPLEMPDVVSEMMGQFIEGY